MQNKTLWNSQSQSSAPEQNTQYKNSRLKIDKIDWKTHYSLYDVYKLPLGIKWNMI